jgi:hypothetical protein
LYSDLDGDFTYKKTRVSGLPDAVDSLYTHAGKGIKIQLFSDNSSAKSDGEKEGFYPEIAYSGLKVGLNANNTPHFDPSVAYKNYIDIIASTAMV